MASALFDFDDCVDEANKTGYPILRWLDVVQEKQDEGCTWGDAVKVADISSPWED